jgi:predicted aspartyl protease
MPSVTGSVNERLEPVVTVRLVGGPRGWTEVECVVDTGFVGAGLVLPREVVEDLGLVVIGSEEVETVGGATVTADITVGQAEWLGEVRSVLIIVNESYLVGSHLLDGTRLMIDYGRRTLTVER